MPPAISQHALSYFGHYVKEVQISVWLIVPLFFLLYRTGSDGAALSVGGQHCLCKHQLITSGETSDEDGSRNMSGMLHLIAELWKELENT